MELIKPMKAPSKSCHMLLRDGNLELLSYPLLASYKYDGVRATIQSGKVYSSTLKLIPNLYTQKILGTVKFNELDGELIVGEPNAPDAFRKTMSGVMSRAGEPNVKFYIFDDLMEDNMDCSYTTRYSILCDWLSNNVDFTADGPIVLVKQKLIKNVKELLEYETHALSLGYEGLMLRDPCGKYKEGPARVSLKSGELLKLKRFEDSEFKITGFIEAETNLNKATKNALGQTKRSSHKDGKVAKGTLGSILGIDIHSKIEVTVATGTLTKEERLYWWEHQSEFLGEIGVYKFFPSGSKDKPRFPTFKGLRSQIDITKDKKSSTR